MPKAICSGYKRVASICSVTDVIVPINKYLFVVKPILNIDVVADLQFIALKT